MDSFYKFWDKFNGPLYQDGTPPPVKYNFEKMDFSRVQDDQGEWKLKNISHEETGSVSREDGNEWMLKNFKGNKLGPQMTDLEFKKFLGQTW